MNRLSLEGLLDSEERSRIENIFVTREHTESLIRLGVWIPKVLLDEPQRNMRKMLVARGKGIPVSVDTEEE